MPLASRRWDDISSDDERPCECSVKALKSTVDCPPSPCSTVAPPSECARDGELALQQSVRWADLESDPEEHDVDEASEARLVDLADSDAQRLTRTRLAPSCIVGVTQQGSSVPASPKNVEGSRPRFLRVNREQRAQQAKKAIVEFLSLDFDAVSPEEQGGVVQRMLGTVKSLEVKDTYWNSEGERLEEDRYRLLDLEEADMYAIARHVNKAAKHCEKRSFRKAYDNLCEVRPWLRGDDLIALRVGWESKKHSREAKKQSKQVHKEQEEVEGWQTVGGKNKKEAKAEPKDSEQQIATWEVVNGRKKKGFELDSVSRNSQQRPSKYDEMLPKSEVDRAEHRQKQASMKDKTQCQFIIGIEEENKFRVVRRILGKAGQNMKHIAEETGAKLRLLGRGSGFLEGPVGSQQESADPLMLCISAPDKASYEQSKKLAGDLLEDIYTQYRQHCRKVGQLAPNVHLDVHEGYRQGAR